MKLFESRERSYVLAEVIREEWRSALRVVSTKAQPNATASTLRSYIVASGKPDAELT